MRFSTVFGLFAASTSVLAGPIYSNEVAALFKRAENATGYGNGSNVTNGSNGTIPGTDDDYLLKVYITGGSYDISSNSSDYEDVEFTTLYNTTSALNFTQLYYVSSLVNETLNNDSYYGVVILSSEASLESLSFFTNIVVDSDKVIVVAEDLDSAIWVANDDSNERGTLSIGPDTGLIYSGIAAVPVGIITTDGPVWFLDSSYPSLLDYDSFNSLPSNLTSAPIVPIIFDGDFSSDLISTVGDSLDGLVVVLSTTATNATSSDLSSDELPVVYAQAGPSLGYVSTDDIPESAISAGYLTPTQAQLLLSVAIANGYTDPDSVSDLFP